MKDLIEKYQEAQRKVSELYHLISNTPDGFIYLTKLRCYGSITWYLHKNSFVVQELCDEYYGENGIVEVYTTNPDHNITSYGGIQVVTDEEIKNIRKDNVSMTEAICNLLTKTI